MASGKIGVISLIIVPLCWISLIAFSVFSIHGLAKWFAQWKENDSDD